ncbi:hypothetical protein KAR10_02415, partial [bacterium]|nr:hypothetical protein [bacterium]
SQTKSSQLLIANPSHSSIPAVKSNNIFEAIGGLFAAIGKGIINTINSIGKGISGLWNSIFGGKEATLKPTGQTQSSSTLGAGPLVLPVLSEAEGSNAEGRTHPSAAVKAGVKAVVENTVIKPTIEISKKIAAKLLYAVDRLQQEAELLLSDLSEKKLDRIVEIIKFDVRLLETTNPLLGALVKGVSWAGHKLKEMISKKEKITMADLKAAAKELMGELKSIVRWLGGIRGQIQKSKISEGLVKTLQVIEERIHKLRPSVDHNLMQRVQKKLGLTGKLAIKIIMGTDALEKIASEKDSSIITKLAASLNPGAILSKTLESLRETKTISGADLVKSQAVLFIKLGSETLKLCYPILYGVQAVSVVVGEGTEKVMLARGAEAQKAEKWGDIAGEVVLFAGLGTLGNAGMKLIEKAVMTGGKGTFFFAINEVVAFGGGYLHNEWGVSASLTETLSEGVWIPLGIAGAKATKSVVAWSAKKLNLMSLSKQIESNVKSRKAEWKDETGKKGRAKEHAKLDQQINKYFSGKGKGFDQIQIKTSAKGMDQGAGGEVLLREISKAKSKLHGIKQRKRLFDETIADTGKNLA